MMKNLRRADNLASGFGSALYLYLRHLLIRSMLVSLEFETGELCGSKVLLLRGELDMCVVHGLRGTRFD